MLDLKSVSPSSAVALQKSCTTTITIVIATTDDAAAAAATTTIAFSSQPAITQRRGEHRTAPGKASPVASRRLHRFTSASTFSTELREVRIHKHVHLRFQILPALHTFCKAAEKLKISRGFFTPSVRERRCRLPRCKFSGPRTLYLRCFH